MISGKNKGFSFLFAKEQDRNVNTRSSGLDKAAMAGRPGKKNALVKRRW